MLPRLLFLSLLLEAGACAQEPRVHTGGGSDLNRLVLNAVGRMPTGGRYSTTAQANQRLAAAVRLESTGLTLSPSLAQPSYCSGATYQVFLEVVSQLNQRGGLNSSPELLRALLVHGQRDGEGVWGRWNANGPGTARLFAEAGLGRNFTDWSQARAGDFMKIWWNNEIGQRERGHSVIFLEADADDVIFWSSNVPNGYGRRSVPRTDVKWAVFSRFEHADAVQNLAEIPRRDAYLAEMLTRSSSRAEVANRCGLRE
jgi:hypothetical protein